MSTMAIHSERQFKIHPQQFALWAAIASMVMMFAAFTSAYIVKKAGAGDAWQDFTLPNIFFINTLVIIASSITMHLSLRAFRRNQFQKFRITLGITLILGIAFLIGQLQGWEAMNNIGVYITNSDAGAFLVVISGTHGVHILGGVIALLITFVVSLVKSYRPIDQLMLETNPNKHLKLQMVATYWHFVDILWIYLFLFFYFNHL